MIIGVSGKARAGKDSFFTVYSYRGYRRGSFAEELKKRVRRDFRLSPEHTDGKLKEAVLPALNGHTPREVLIAYGNMFREFRPNYWCDMLFEELDRTPGNYVITDVRYENEAEYVKSRGGILIRLERHPSRDGMIDDKTKQSISETALDNYKGFDLVLPGAKNENFQDLETFAYEVDRYVQSKAAANA